ncbi:anti-sigma regulatory factor (Ser/Thr protein kinase) [Nocardioides ginsengisegetis]|uniref:Anti-sigma regulatory factor (Ser/Thr protein kinase) n=1 Tax=Nocardioides ginsengisegetis TaxID=661491 RepID=A0A7W3J258_9ACTN|nr:sensor histidine kinase [Nocardioides ginsengisegetis]MBA8804829.1 anti-sigma regulatory factor (Ser/Thr protein kinase) [Nocardioides ginsengisegetis]
MSALAHEAMPRFEHATLCYRDDAEFLDLVGGFVRDGVERDEAVLVAEPTQRLAQLRDALGDDARRVEWLDMTEAGSNPARIIALWAEFVSLGEEAGRAMRGVGEPAWPGRRPEEFDECRLHELLLNRQFDGGPGWLLVCPYDITGLPAYVVAESLRTHPLRYDHDGFTTTPFYDGLLVDRTFAAPLPAPPADARTLAYDAPSAGLVRTALQDFGTSCGVTEERIEDLSVAGWEIAVNSIQHGGGRGVLRLWREPGAMVAQFEDDGVITDALVGRQTPPLDGTGGRGVYLAHQLCDLVHLRSSTGGTVVRLVTWL